MQLAGQGRVWLCLSTLRECDKLTFSDGKVRDSLPPVHRHSPTAFNATTAQVDDQLAGVAIQLCKHRLQAIESEGARGEKERGDDDLPRRENKSLSCFELLKDFKIE